ncbi:MAG: aminoacyl-histidine dipeptidase [Mucinivorans sp.]
MNNIALLEPREVFSIFSEILKVPRPSKREQLIRQFILDFAVAHSLESRTDALGNVVVVKPATPGYENHKGIVLQSHMDMVCEKESEKVFDFDTQAIEAYVEDGWVLSRGTTLGADCGIGMAIQMAVLVSTTLCHPALEALFTVDEEQGLTGANGLGQDMITGKWLINLDSEDEGQIYIGCAGGIDTIATFAFNWERTAAQSGSTIKVSGLCGGHSGDDINKGRANANKLLSRVLYHLIDEFPELSLSFIGGGNLRNAIAREASCVVCGVATEQLQPIFDRLYAGFKEEFCITEPELVMTIEPLPVMVDRIIPSDVVWRLIDALVAVPHGVIAMSQTLPGMVETSTNLASIKIQEQNLKSSLVVTTSQRSSLVSGKQYAADSVLSVFRLAGAEVVTSDGYPGWKPNISSELTKLAEEVYIKIFSQQPQVKVIHAGLECGLILSKHPHMDAISVGPTILGAHSPMERLNIKDVVKVWHYLSALMASL